MLTDKLSVRSGKSAPAGCIAVLIPPQEGARLAISRDGDVVFASLRHTGKKKSSMPLSAGGVQKTPSSSGVMQSRHHHSAVV